MFLYVWCLFSKPYCAFWHPLWHLFSLPICFSVSGWLLLCPALWTWRISPWTFRPVPCSLKAVSLLFCFFLSHLLILSLIRCPFSTLCLACFCLTLNINVPIKSHYWQCICIYFILKRVFIVFFLIAFFVFVELIYNYFVILTMKLNNWSIYCAVLPSERSVQFSITLYLATHN